jgi:uncharacterized protein (TIGR00661 family)
MNVPSTILKHRILVAPLDWGLGHATRCIPVIRHLLNHNCEVILAGEGKVEALLRTEFPHLLFLPLKGYGIRYAKTRLGLMSRLLQQIPQVLKAIAHENEWLQQVVANHKIEAVISDNRYGLHHPHIYSVFITHQLLIKTPLGSWGNRLLQKLNYKYINKFNQCWVPDYEETDNLGGQLSHPAVMPAVPVRYIGPLTRFEDGEDTLEHYVLVLLSGPEPQRSLLEQKILQQVKDYPHPLMIVRGLPGTVGLPKVPYHVIMVNHLPSPTLQKAIQQASFVISRTGYSTVMELLSFKKKSILIPTPGQTEQEYLAKHLMKQNRALCLPQQKFSLINALSLAGSFKYQFPEAENTQALSDAVEHLLTQLQGQPA